MKVVLHLLGAMKLLAALNDVEKFLLVAADMQKRWRLNWQLHSKYWRRLAGTSDFF